MSAFGPPLSARYPSQSLGQLGTGNCQYNGTILVHSCHHQTPFELPGITIRLNLLKGVTCNYFPMCRQIIMTWGHIQVENCTLHISGGFSMDIVKAYSWI